MGKITSCFIKVFSAFLFYFFPFGWWFKMHHNALPHFPSARLVIVKVFFHLWKLESFFPGYPGSSCCNFIHLPFLSTSLSILSCILTLLPEWAPAAYCFVWFLIGLRVNWAEEIGAKCGGRCQGKQCCYLLLLTSCSEIGLVHCKGQISQLTLSIRLWNLDPYGAKKFKTSRPTA